MATVEFYMAAWQVVQPHISDLCRLSALQSSEYEEYSDSEDDMGPRLKPVFVRKWVCSFFLSVLLFFCV